jgi:hypothetical protein
MTRCEWQNKYCDREGYFREDQGRYFCGDHYEEKKKQQRAMNRALKKAGLEQVDFDIRNHKKEASKQ